MKISPNLSRAFQVANLPAMVLVILIHYNTRAAIADKSAGDANYFLQQLLANGIARVAVPFFALAAGFFFFLNYAGTASYVRNLRKRVRTLFVPYLVVSVIMTAGFLVARAVVGSSHGVKPLETIAEIVLRPRSAQFWFLRDLMVLTLVSPVIYLLVRILREFWVVALGAAWLLELQVLPKISGVYLVNIETLFFFTLGCWLVARAGFLERLVALRASWLAAAAVVWLGLLVARVCVDPTMDLWYVRRFTMTSLVLYKAAILAGLVVLVRSAASGLLGKRTLIFLSGYTFFAFLFHYFPLNLLVVRISALIVPAEYAFYVNAPLAAALAFAAAFVCDRYLNPLYRLLTGDRGPGKVLRRLTSP